MSQYISKYVVCPYYHRHDDNRICCEGTGLKNTNTINLVFVNNKTLKEYTTKYCNDIEGYKRCMICRALNEKYGVLNKI
jgi:translation initiation factor 2 beta subunit (eIF-2beta)/eIF-5